MWLCEHFHCEDHNKEVFLEMNDWKQERENWQVQREPQWKHTKELTVVVLFHAAVAVAVLDE